MENHNRQQHKKNILYQRLTMKSCLRRAWKRAASARGTAVLPTDLQVGFGARGSRWAKMLKTWD
jgi:hypothetical protein